MKTELSVGKEEKHSLCIEQLLTGGIQVKVDGKQTVKGNITKRKAIEFVVGEREKHSVRVRKERGGFASWNIEIDGNVLPSDLLAQAEGRVATARMVILLLLLWATLSYLLISWFWAGELDETSSSLPLAIAHLTFLLIMFFVTRAKNKVIVSCCLAAIGIVEVASIILLLLAFGPTGRIVIDILIAVAIWRGSIAAWRANTMIRTKYIPRGLWPDFVSYVIRPEALQEK